MTTVSDIRNRLSADAQFAESEFYTSVFSYGMGVIELLTDAGYVPGEAAYVEMEADLGSAEVFTEGQALGAPVESTYLTPKFAFKNLRAVIRSSGDERRALGDSDQGARIADPARKVQRAIEAIRYLMAKTFDDAAAYGVQGIISAATYNYGDAARTTYTKLASYELNASSAAISTALLNKFAYRSAEDPYGCIFDATIASAVQASKIAELGSGKLAIPSANGQLNLVPTGMAIGTAPLFVLPNLTTSVILGLTGVRNGKWKWAWHEPNPGRFHILDLGADNSDTPTNLQISTSGCMYCVNPNQQGKLYGLSTA
jgi:hypothetical protein